MEVAARGRVMHDIDRTLEASGVGAIRDGVGCGCGRWWAGSGPLVVRLTLLGIDPGSSPGDWRSTASGCWLA